jgi:hypothetical protein
MNVNDADDAARYRYLRDRWARTNGMGWYMSTGYIGGVGADIRDGSFDAAVDRAMEQTPRPAEDHPMDDAIGFSGSSQL